MERETEQEPERGQEADRLLEEQGGKGYGAGEGEREQALEEETQPPDC
ncbi:MAG: hypothetical protein M3312_00985 [Actinomycetota bacterium]|nr:hypothetical protein [Actinomycetota bacterium]